LPRKSDRTRAYRPKGWAHYLDRDLRERGDDALKRKNRRHLLALEKKIQRVKGKLWTEGNENHLPGARLTSEEIAEATASDLGMSVEEYRAAQKAINKLKDDDALADADAGTLFLWDLRKHGAALLTREQEAELARRARSGDERAIEQFVNANVRLCARVARYFRSRGLDRLLEYTDLVSAGVVGLRAAVAKFDPDRGTRLASFAYSYITGAIRDELEKAALIRLPREAALLVAKIIRATDELSLTLDRKPTDEEIATHLGVATAVVSRSLQAISEVSKPARSPREHSGPQTTEAGGGGKPRFDENTADAWDMRGRSHNYRADMDGAFGADSADDVGPAVELALEASEAWALLYKALTTLTKQEREIVSRYFDLVENPDIDHPNPHGGESLTKIARTMGISKQRASKVERRALVKLRRVLEVARATDG
jgi:RNA polymerase sigma factor (sigma-70 family)